MVIAGLAVLVCVVALIPGEERERERPQLRRTFQQPGTVLYARPSPWFQCTIAARSRTHASAGSPWQKHLADVTKGGLDEAQLRTIVRVLHNEPSLAPVWNWQKRGVHPAVQS